jgi:photosystem II stability/assembly factor-like uncharacterized protein
MKYFKIFFSIVIFVLLFMSLESYSQQIMKWDLVDSEHYNYRSSFYDRSIDYYDSLNIILISGQNNFRKSTDGGRTWSDGIAIEHAEGQKQVRSLAYPSKDLIVVVGDTVEYLTTFKTKQWGVFWISRDGGDSWEEIVLDSNSFVTSVEMIDENRGIAYKAMTSNAYYEEPENRPDSLLITNDAWISWSAIPLPIESYESVNLFYFEDNTIIILSKQDNGGERFLKTTDYGENWEESMDFTSVAKRITTSHFTSSKKGWAFGYMGNMFEFYKLVFLKTSDGGMTWESKFDTTFDGAFYLSYADFCDENNGMVTNQLGPYFVTSDGGETWQTQKLYPTINFPDPNLYSLAYTSKNNIVLTNMAWHIFHYSGESELKFPILEFEYDWSKDKHSAFYHWTPIEGADSYDLQIVETERNAEVWNGNFEDLDIFEEIYDFNDTEYKIENLSFNKKYSARVRAKNSSEDSRWARIVLFVTLESPIKLPAPTQMYPEFGVYIPTNSITFKWHSVPGADSYEFQLAENIAYIETSHSKVYYDIKDLTDTTFSVNNLELDMEYFWRVRAVDQDGVSDYSRGRFSTMDVSTSIFTEKENNINDYDIFPNPATSQITLSLSEEFISEPEIDIIDYLGNVIRWTPFGRWSPSEKSITINTSSLSPGVYFLRVRSGEKVEVRKYVVI